MSLDPYAFIGRTIRIKQSNLSDVGRDLGNFARPGMKAKVVGFDTHDDLIALGVDFTPFEAHNRPLEEATVEQADGRLVTHREAGTYKPTTIIYFNEDGILDECEIVEDNPHLEKILEAYSSEAEAGLSYQEFLETHLVRAMQAGYGIEAENTHARTP
jgi:hypothetical protein